jgi:hypothetical protein
MWWHFGLWRKGFINVEIKVQTVVMVARLIGNHAYNLNITSLPLICKAYR